MTTKTSTTPVALTHLRAGDRGRVHATRLERGDSAMLSALGLGDHCSFRVSKAGDPWILEVLSTRIGLSEAVARSLLVIPERA